MKYLTQTENITEEKSKDLDYGRVVSDTTDNSSYLVNYSHTHYNAINLGLPSNTLWCDRNVGAEKDTDTGLYFQWGDTQGYTADEIGKKKEFTINDYKYYDNTIKTYTKYQWNNVGEKLDLSDDAVLYHTHKFTLPTNDQCNELINNCTYSWETKDGVKGALLTSKINSNSIFLPLSGYALNNKLYKQKYSFLFTNEAFIDGIELTFTPTNIYTYTIYRYQGCCLRGVTIKQ
jgi:hypothetical protein